MLLLHQSTIAPIYPGLNMSHRQTSSAFAIHLLSSGPPPGSAALRRPPPGCCGCGYRWAETGRASPPPAGTAAPALPTPVQRPTMRNSRGWAQSVFKHGSPCSLLFGECGRRLILSWCPKSSVALKSHFDFLLLPFCTQIECPGFMRYIKLYERHQIKMYRRSAASLHPQEFFFFAHSGIGMPDGMFPRSVLCRLGKAHQKRQKKKILGSCSDKQIWRETVFFFTACWAS